MKMNNGLPLCGGDVEGNCSPAPFPLPDPMALLDRNTMQFMRAGNKFLKRAHK